MERMTGSDFWPEVPKYSFLRMRSENMSKIVSPLQ